MAFVLIIKNQFIMDIAMKKNMRRALLTVSTLVLSAFVSTASFAEKKALTVFGENYNSPAEIAKDQAQIIYYRSPNGQSQNGAANIYVDREFNTALLPGGFTAFCVKPGVHILGAYLKDEPLYKGKSEKVKSVELEAGQNYYFKVDESGVEIMQEVLDPASDPEIRETRKQMHLINRASSVVPCNAVYHDYVLSGDVLFRFGKYSERDLLDAGREKIDSIAKKLKGSSQKIVVMGHTDAIGSAQSNMTLGLNRAKTVRNVLVDEGVMPDNISVSSVGSEQPISHGCEGLDRQSKIQCYAPDRRVVIRVIN